MVTLETIKKEATEIRDILIKCKTVGDLRNLRHIGISEADILIDIGEGLTDDLCLSGLPQDAAFLSVRINNYLNTCIDFPTLDENGTFYFDVYESEIEGIDVFLEDCTLDTIDTMYTDFINKCYKVTDIHWDIDEDDFKVDLPDTVIIPPCCVEENEDMEYEITEYLSDTYGYCVCHYNVEFPKNFNYRDSAEVINLYELYKIDWMRRISPDDLIDARRDYYEGGYPETHTFDEYLEEFGFDSQIYACFDEFFENELRDTEYMLNLIGTSEKLKDFYLKMSKDLGFEEEKYKTINISASLEKSIVAFCNDELNYHINESGCANEYDSEIKAQIELLRLLGHTQMADDYAAQYGLKENVD